MCLSWPKPLPGSSAGFCCFQAAALLLVFLAASLMVCNSAFSGCWHKGLYCLILAVLKFIRTYLTVLTFITYRIYSSRAVVSGVVDEQG